MRHRQNVLDVVRAVTRVADRYPDVTAWWYVPRLLHDPKIEIVIEADAAPLPEFERVARDLQTHLPGTTVAARARAPEDESRRLYRILSRAGARQSTG